MTEEALDATQLLVTAVGHKKPVSRKVYSELVNTLADRRLKAAARIAC